MDQGTVVDGPIPAGRRLARELSAAGFDVTAAFWVRSSDSPPALYIASKEVDENGIKAAYEVIHETLKRKPEIPISPFDVRLIGANDPITRDVIVIRERGRGADRATLTGYNGPQLGGRSIERAYIYPASL